MHGHLSVAEGRGVTDALQASLEEDAALFPEEARYAVSHYPREPYRQKMTFVYRRLQATLEAAGRPWRADHRPRPGAYPSAAAFLADLRLVQASLREQEEILREQEREVRRLVDHAKKNQVAQTDLDRIWNLSVLLFLGVAVYAFAAGDGTAIFGELLRANTPANRLSTLNQQPASIEGADIELKPRALSSPLSTLLK